MAVSFANPVKGSRMDRRWQRRALVVIDLRRRFGIHWLNRWPWGSYQLEE